MDFARAVSARLPGARISESGADRIAYARDLWPRRLIEARAGGRPTEGPRLVVWPRSTEEVARLVALCRDEGVPVVPYGAGSGVCGAISPDERTVVIDLKEMADTRIDADAPLLEAGPGAIGITLEEDLERAGYTIGHFPSSILCSSVGGWIAARGAGQCSGLYGKIEDMVAELEVVLGDGEVVTLKRRFGGPNLIPLFIGSEGTLGVVTRSKLRLHPRPAVRGYAAFAFPRIEAGWEAMRELFQAGLRPAVARLYDPIDSALMRQGSVKEPLTPATPGAPARPSRRQRLSGVMQRALRVPKALNALIEAAEGNLLGSCTLVLVFEGDAEAVGEDVRRAEQLLRALDARALGEGPARRWFQHRYSVSYRQSPVFRMGAFSDTMEVAAPWSRLSDLYDGVRAALGEHVLVMAHLSHAYPDGCSIYFSFAGAAEDDQRALARYDRAWRAALTAAIEAGGTLSHHHGVGRSKAPQLGEELGHGIQLIGRVMAACDPAGIFNPGALLPREPLSREGVIGPEPPAAPSIDAHSGLATLPGDMPLGVAEELVGREGLSLGLESMPTGATVSSWLAEGLPGARDAWSDPVDQMVSGFVARIGDELLVVRPAPRRAVGPDLSALFVGAGGRVGDIEQATVVVHRRSDGRARRLPFDYPRTPPVAAREQALFERVCATAKRG